MPTYTIVAFFLDNHRTRVEAVQADTPQHAMLTKDDDRAYNICAVFDGALTPVLIEEEDLT
jgi:hypothetical protein